MPRFPFLPTEKKFFDLFEEGTDNLVKAAMVFQDLMDNWTDVESKIYQIVDLEHEGDFITHQIMKQLHRTFVTPLDREDIALLVNTIDDILDYIHAASQAMLLYKVDRPTQRAIELAAIMVKAVNELEQAIRCLRHHSDLKKILDHCVELNRLENDADRIYRSAVSELFSETTEIIDIIKWRELYQIMESSIDKCEDLANVLEGVVLKNA